MIKFKRFDISSPILNDDDYADACVLADEYRRRTNALERLPKFDPAIIIAELVEDHNGNATGLFDP